jgi:hypothetical protein
MSLSDSGFAPPPVHAAKASATNLLKAIFDAWIQTWKDLFRMVFWFFTNPVSLLPALLILALIVWLILRVQGAVWHWGSRAVEIMAIFFYVRALDRYALRVVQHGHEVPPVQGEPKPLATLFRLLRRPAVPPATEGDFRHYFYRAAWWDFRVILLEVFGSMAETSKPVMDWAAKTKGRGILSRSFMFPVVLTIAFVGVYAVIFFAGLAVVHLVVLFALYLVASLHQGVVRPGAEPDVSSPRRLAGAVTIGLWVLLALLPYASKWSAVPHANQPPHTRGTGAR